MQAQLHFLALIVRSAPAFFRGPALLGQTGHRRPLASQGISAHLAMDFFVFPTAACYSEAALPPLHHRYIWQEAA
jgi:hypothetical protein